MTINRCTDKGDMVYIYIHTHTHNEILFSHEKEGNLVMIAELLETERRSVTRAWEVGELGRSWGKGADFQLEGLGI